MWTGRAANPQAGGVRYTRRGGLDINPGVPATRMAPRRTHRRTCDGAVIARQRKTSSVRPSTPALSLMARAEAADSSTRRGILLRDTVQVGHGLVYLRNALGLLAWQCWDLAHQGG